MSSIAERGVRIFRQAEKTVEFLASLPYEREWQTWQRLLTPGKITPADRQAYKDDIAQREVMLRSIDTTSRTFSPYPPAVLFVNSEGLENQLRQIQTLPDKVVDQALQQKAAQALVDKGLANHWPMRKVHI